MKANLGFLRYSSYRDGVSHIRSDAGFCIICGLALLILVCV